MESEPIHRMRHFTPLRYPGGKGKLATFIKSVIKENKLCDGEYIEPYAGGAAIAMELLFHEYVSRVHINDMSRPIYSFWSSVLSNTDNLCRLIRDTPLTVQAWDQQKEIFAQQLDFDLLDVGFATFFLNRTNRSGILNGGIIGGRDQSGKWKIDARFNRTELINRIEAIAKMESRIQLSRMDAITFMKQKMKSWPAKSLVYLDPPYFKKGRELYYDFYQKGDHESVRDFVLNQLSCEHWIVSYDNVDAIHALYAGCRKITYGIGYSARDAREGSEAMFFSNSLKVPALSAPLKPISEELGPLSLIGSKPTAKKFAVSLRAG